MAATPEMIAIARKVRPHAACVVPERRQERTTEGGLDAAGQREALRGAVARLAEPAFACRCSLPPSRRRSRRRPRSVRRSSRFIPERGATLLPLATPRPAPPNSNASCGGAALAKSAGLEVHAGHGLDFVTAERIAALPEIVELNIGHFLIGEAVFDGLAEAVRRMRAAMDRGRARIDDGRS